MTILSFEAFRKDRQRWFSPYSNSTVNLTNDDDFNIRPHLFNSYDQDSSRWNIGRLCRPACIPIVLILALIVIIVLLPLWGVDAPLPIVRTECTDTCRISLVESIPEGLVFPPGSPTHPSTYDAWLELIRRANHTIEIAAFYFYLTKDGQPDTFPSAFKGYDVYNHLMEAGAERKIKIKIAENLPSKNFPSVDAELLAEKAGAEVRKLNFDQLMHGGVLHTKLWVVDRRHIYVGSANMDWRSLTQVKELGAVVYDCPCLAEDMGKIFDAYWALGVEGAALPKHWPIQFSTSINADTPLEVKLNGTAMNTYLSSSPPPFCPDGRTQDLDSILNTIQAADKFVYIAVMDYVPLLMYGKPIRFWPEINNALETAAIERSVEVRILIGYWKHTRDYELKFLKSLESINGTFKGTNVQVKLFKVPATKEQEKIPFARVNHNKYMVTDKTAYIGTSNWSGDYFVNTAGVGLIVEKVTNGTSAIRDQLQAVFERDWNSPYTKRLYEMPEPHEAAQAQLNETDTLVGIEYPMMALDKDQQYL